MSQPTLYTLGSAFPTAVPKQNHQRQVLNGLFLGVATPLKVWDGVKWKTASAPTKP